MCPWIHRLLCNNSEVKITIALCDDLWLETSLSVALRTDERLE